MWYNKSVNLCSGGRNGRMRIQALQLRNFRNYTALAMEPDEGLCVLTGENAAGKTNVLESIFLSALGRSHRTTRDAELIRSGAESGSIKLTLDTRGGTRTIECRLIANERKRLTIDGAPLARSGELLGCLNVVMFAPEDLILVKGGPAERRRFLDMEISQLKPAYYYTLQRYNAALKQRNALLKDPDAVYAGMIEPWDEQLSRLGAAITVERAAFLQELSAIAADLHLQLSDHRETLLLAYQPNLPDADAEQLARAMRERLAENLERDLYRGFTSVGPHRDDLEMTLDGYPLRRTGSQGQLKSFTVALRLALFEDLNKHTSSRPLLLLDDIFDKLDAPRVEAIVAAVSDTDAFGQIFITDTNRKHIDSIIRTTAGSYRLFGVEEGHYKLLTKR